MEANFIEITEFVCSVSTVTNANDITRGGSKGDEMEIRGKCTIPYIQLCIGPSVSDP